MIQSSGLYSDEHTTDFVQELYVKELKGYKAPPKVSYSTCAQGTHQSPTCRACSTDLGSMSRCTYDSSFVIRPPTLTRARSASSDPFRPKAPAVPSSSELSSQLEAYAASEPDHAEAPASSSSEGALTEGGDVNAFLREAAADVKVEAHH